MRYYSSLDKQEFGTIPPCPSAGCETLLWLIHTAQDRDRDRDREAVGFYVTLCTVHNTQGQGQVHGAIVFYFAHSIPCPSPGLVQCE